MEHKDPQFIFLTFENVFFQFDKGIGVFGVN